jgi:hypothetical protein
MKQLTVQISIGQRQFSVIESLSVESSWNFLADKATITLPRRLLTQGSLSNPNAPDLNSIIKVGDKVKIELGYDFVFETEFTGYVKSISPEVPVKIECEDAMWLLKQTNLTNSWRKVSLTELLQYIIPSGIEYEAIGEVNLGKFRVDRVSAFDILKKIREVYGLVSYMRDDKLIIGFPYQEESNNVKLHFQKNVDDKKSNLAFRKADQVKLKFKAISIQPDGSKIEVELGDNDGQVRSLHLPVGLDESEIRKIAEEKMKLFTFDGYEGDITSFGQPYARHSDTVTITDDLYSDREGTYSIDTVKVEVGSGGYRRTLTLGNKVT